MDNYYVMKVKNVIQELEDVKTFVIDNSENKIQHKPGQFALLTPVMGHGEMVISISSSHMQEEELHFSVKNVGRVSEIMHGIQEGDEILVRGPYGNSFPINELKNKNLIFIGGGIGIAPLRSVINTVFAEREKYKDVFILYGARSSKDVMYKKEMLEDWPKVKDTVVACTVDKGDDNWKGRVGFVPVLMDEVSLPLNDTKILTCGPPIMIKFILKKLKEMGYATSDIITTLEMKMKCGVGKCGRCNIGSECVCVDGPVFTLEELEKLPTEY